MCLDLGRDFERDLSLGIPIESVIFRLTATCTGGISQEFRRIQIFLQQIYAIHGVECSTSLQV